MSLVFQIVGRFRQWSLYLTMLEKGLQLKTTALLVFFNKVFEKLINNGNVDHPEKCDFFFWFPLWFSSQSTADILTVVSDRIDRTFNRSGVTRAVALDISKALNRV